MNPERSTRRWLTVVLFAVAMAWVEAAVVFYLRTLVDRIEPYQPQPLPDMHGLLGPEIIREAATMIMLACAGALAGRTARARLAYLVIAFGIWDIFYYVFLKALTGWPATLLDWDILFLIPLPWWGPVIAPMTVAAGMILFGTVSLRRDPPFWPTRRSLAFCVTGLVLLLWAFMYEAIALILRGASQEEVQNLLPQIFPWPLFWLGMVLSTVPALDLILQSIAHTGFKQIPRRLRA